MVVMVHDIFISYSKKDIDFARHLRKLLQQTNFSVWMDENEINPSEDWWEIIEQNVIAASVIIVIMSPNSRNSKWVKRELLVAEKHHKSIFPVLLDGEVWSRLADIQAEDMTEGLKAKLPDKLKRKLYGAIHRTAAPISQIESKKNQPRIWWQPRIKLIFQISITFGLIGLVAGFIILFLPRLSPGTVTQTLGITRTVTPAQTATLFTTSTASIFTPILSSETPTVTQTSMPPTETPTNTLQPTTTPIPPINTPITQNNTQNMDFALTIFRDTESFTLYVPQSDQSYSLVDLTFSVTNAQGDQTDLFLNAFPSFQGMPFETITSLNKAICFRLMRQSASVPAPLDCSDGDALLLTQGLADADVFWYDRVLGQDRTVMVLQDREILGICAAGQSTCVIGGLTNAQTAPSFLASASAMPGYPCEATIVFSTGGLLNQVRVSPLKKSPLRSAIQQGSIVSILAVPQVSEGIKWYQITYAEDQNPGWISAQYLIPSPNCPD